MTAVVSVALSRLRGEGSLEGDLGILKGGGPVGPLAGGRFAGQKYIISGIQYIYMYIHNNIMYNI